MNTIKIWVSEYSMKHVDLSDLNNSTKNNFIQPTYGTLAMATPIT